MGRENSDSAQSFSSAVTALECIRVFSSRVNKTSTFSATSTPWVAFFRRFGATDSQFCSTMPSKSHWRDGFPRDFAQCVVMANAAFGRRHE